MPNSVKLLILVKEMELAKSQDIPENLSKEYDRTKQIVFEFVKWLHFCIMDTSRDPNFTNNHLLSFLSQDIIETLVGVQLHILEGIHNPPIRESRFLLELSIKIALIQGENYDSSIDSKLAEFNKDIKSTKISLMKRINLNYLQVETQKIFYEEVGRLYGKASDFVHVTPQSIEQRKNRTEEGRTVGYESIEDLANLNDLLQSIYAASLVFLSHSVPQYVVGDWHVDNDGELTDWYYIKSRYIAEIDSTLDYKHERQQVLEKVVQKRKLGLKF